MAVTVAHLELLLTRHLIKIQDTNGMIGESDDILVYGFTLTNTELQTVTLQDSEPRIPRTPDRPASGRIDG